MATTLKSCNPLAEAVQRTMAWYKAQHSGADVRSLCEEDIAAYEAAL
jgi:CDP-glucose 4,6-dehydratase